MANQYFNEMRKIIENLNIAILISIIILCKPAIGQPQNEYTILVAGHAYGAHAGTNIGLHPPFIKKLAEETDSVSALILTGDIVNTSTTASWQQVEKETATLGLTAFYVMGNHDNNATGKAVFTAKHGGLYYSFKIQNDLFIVLNSTESDRSISPTQLQFLKNALLNAGSDCHKVFVFYHEVIWNSHEKYKLVRSNSRSRYAQIKDVSNFWTEVFPVLTANANKKFYLFSGDVGGNPDAIAAFYDKWQNVTLLSSGMGEVADENYLKVKIRPDTVLFELVALNDKAIMKPMEWYSVPVKPDFIEGPEKISTSAPFSGYSVSPVFNATNYLWSLSEGISGSSDSASVNLHFDNDFQKGQITASAVNDGFGISEPAALEIQNENYTGFIENKIDPEFSIFQSDRIVQIRFYAEENTESNLQVFNSAGVLLYQKNFSLTPGLNTHSFSELANYRGFVILKLQTKSYCFSTKTLIN
jgi:hypothetical protein